MSVMQDDVRDIEGSFCFLCYSMNGGNPAQCGLPECGDWAG